MAREKICGIYAIKNKINEKYYVGQSVDIHRRWNQHKSELRKNKHHNLKLQLDWQKYGEDNFDFKIIHRCKCDNLDFFEIQTIKDLNSFWNGYNNDFGGQAGELYSCCVDNETYNLLKATMHHKLSHKYRPVLQIDFNGDIVNEWGSGHYAAYVIDGNATEIYKCLHYQAKTHKRYIWIYKDEYNPDTFDVAEYLKNSHNVDYNICQYSIDGTLLNTFNTASEAAKSVGLHENSIYSCLHKRMLSAAGYIWRYSNEDFHAHRIPSEKRRVCQYDKTGKLIAMYETPAEAMKQTGITNGIYDSIYGKVEMSHGFIWRYEGDEVNIKNIKPSIGKYSLDGVLLEVFDSISAALRSINKKNHQPIYENLRGVRDFAHGYVWKYID